MQAVIEGKEWTEEALMALPHDGQKYEVLGGRAGCEPDRCSARVYLITPARGTAGFCAQPPPGVGGGFEHRLSVKAGRLPFSQRLLCTPGAAREGTHPEVLPRRARPGS